MATAGQLIISEFRWRGPNGANDEFIEIYNNTDSAHTVAAASGSGYGTAASDGVTRCSIPNGTVIPARGHYLCVNSVGYSLASYPAGNGTTATGDATYTTNISDNVGIALFNNNTGGASYSLATRLDAVGSTAEANTIYREGTGLPPLVGFSIDYSWYRDMNTATGRPKDTDNNAADFLFVDTNGTSAGGGQRLGAPGPENLSSPTFANASLGVSLLDPCVASTSPPNFVRDFTSDPANNSTFGTINLRRTITNNTGGNITRLRYRVIDITTFPSPTGTSDLRPRTSPDVIVTVDRAPCGSGTSNITARGTTLEQPPSQPHGGGFNSSLSSGTVTLATPLASGASVDVRFLLGIQQTGTVRLKVLVEALPSGGTAIINVAGSTEPSQGGAGTPASPVVTLSGASVTYNAGAPPAVIDSGATVTDPDSASFNGGDLTVSLSANGTADDRLAIRNEGTADGQIGVSGSSVSFNPPGGAPNAAIGTFNGGIGTTPLTVNLNANATPAAVQALVRNITFSNVSPNPATAARTVRFVVFDPVGGASAPATKTIAFNAPPPAAGAPIVTTSAGATVFDKGDPPVAVDPSLTVTDADSPTLATATVQIVGGLVPSEDELAFTPVPGVAGSYNSATGLLGFTGVATVGQYQALLRSVTYRNSAEELTTGSRTVAFQVNDGDRPSPPALRTVAVTKDDELPPTGDTPPSISSVADQTMPDGDARTVAFTVGDAETPPGSLAVSTEITAVDEEILTPRDLQLGGEGDQRTLTIRPPSGKFGRAGVTLRVSDGRQSASTSFSVEVTRGRVGQTTQPPPPPPLVCAGRRQTPGVRRINGVITGTPRNDVILGTNGNDTINGLGGNDLICGFAGNDRLLGGPGNDTISGGDGADVLDGGPGNDVLDGGAGNDRIFGQADDDRSNGGLGDDLLSGGPGADRLLGAAGNDQLFGGPANDQLFGGAGNDRQFGEAGNDRLVGEAGNDLLDGGPGADVMVAGPGRDTCRGGADLVVDSAPGCEVRVAIP